MYSAVHILVYQTLELLIFSIHVWNVAFFTFFLNKKLLVTEFHDDIPKTEKRSNLTSQSMTSYAGGSANFEDGLHTVTTPGKETAVHSYPYISPTTYCPERDAQVNKALPKSKGLSFRRMTIVFASSIGFLFIVIIMLAGLLGSKIARLERGEVGSQTADAA
jgi:hypothetical protein